MEGGAWPRQFNMVSVTCYKKTGFNTVNIPESLSFLQANFTPYTFDALDILQPEGLSEIRIAISDYSSARDIDYCVLSDGTITACYAARVVPQLSSTDVAYLSLEYDPTTSAGGPSNIEILDGVTERHTTANDDMFAFPQSDEYCAPMDPLQVESDEIDFEGSSGNLEYIETTIDIAALLQQFDSEGNFAGTGYTFTDAVSGKSVVVPYVESVAHDSRTQYEISGPTSEGGISVIASSTSPDTQVWVSSTENIQKAIGIIRSLGIESGILNQVVIPVGMAASGTSSGTTGAISKMDGFDQTAISSSLDFSHHYSYTPHNNRVFYGEYAKFGLLSASGAKLECLPEQIGEATDVTPTIRCIADPRMDGKPYFRFQKYLGDETFKGFWISCIPGLEWASAPLIYQGKSGNYQNRENFINSARIEGQQYINENEMAKMGLYAGLLSSVMGIGASVGSSLYNGAGITGVLSGVMGAGMTDAQYELQKSIRTNQYENARQKELSQYALSAATVAPTIEFPFSANAFRDFVGNNVLLYHYYYSDRDVERVDKLLTMYGYKDSVPVTADLFDQRQYFDYVRATGLSIGGDIPMWQKEAIAAQLNAGIRVWHVKPDASYYTSGNPIKTES